jgi:WD40 repeat protein
LLSLCRDALKGKPKYSVSMSTSGVAEDAPTAQSFNPPYVHSVAISPSGRYFAAGVGDGSIAVHELASQHCVQRLWVHSRAAGHVEYPTFIADETLRERMLVSSGNDGRVLVTDLTYDGAASVPATSKRKGRKAAVVPKPKETEDATLSPAKRILYCIDHGCGPNWFTTTSTYDGSIIVADPTPTITVYSGVASRVLARVECAP